MKILSIPLVLALLAAAACRRPDGPPPSNSKDAPEDGKTHADGLKDAGAAKDFPVKAEPACTVALSGPGSVPDDIRLLWTGSGFAAAWSGHGPGTSPQVAESWNIFMARATPRGVPEEKETRLTDSGMTRSFGIAWNGSGFGLAWRQHDAEGRADIFFSVLDETGARVGGDVLVEDESYFDPAAFHLLWTGSGFSLFWSESYVKDHAGRTPLLFRILDAQGKSLGPRVELSSLEMFDVNAAWTGSEFGMSWARGESVCVEDEVGLGCPCGNNDIYFARVGKDGKKIGKPVSITNSKDRTYHPALAWTGSEFGVVWEQKTDGSSGLVMAALGKKGTLVRKSALPSASDGHDPDLAWSGTEYGLAWWVPPSTLFFMRLDGKGGAAGDPVLVSDTTAYGAGASIAWTGSEFGIAWSDKRDGEPRVYLRRVPCSDGP